MSDFVKSMKDLGQFKLIAMVGAALVLIAFFVFISLRISSPMMAPLYSNLSMEDSGRIVQELETQKIPYELRANGTQIMVAAPEALKLRVTLAQQGIPSNGSIVGYEIFDRAESLGTSNFVLNVNMVRALEGELARTIGSLQKVEHARVHLVMPKRELFTREKQEPTASVVLKLRGSLSQSEIEGVANLIATAVPGLTSNKVTILDHSGRALAKGNQDPNDPAIAASKSEEYRIAYESRMVNIIEDLVGKSVGSDKVTAQVTADIDFDRVVRNSETYDPEGQVVRSIQGTNEREQSDEGQANENVSVKNNLPENQANPAGGGNNSKRVTERNDETTNYEISKVVENQVKETGTVKRLSVAIMVDGIYSPTPKGEMQFSPRAPEELKKLEMLAKSAIGFDEKRGDTLVVDTMKFASTPEMVMEEGPFDWLKKDLRNIIQTLVLGGVAIMAILLIIRPLVNRAIEASATAASLAEEEKSVLAGPQLTAALEDKSMAMGVINEEDEDDGLISIDKMRGKGRSAAFRKIAQVFEKHPDEAVGVLRSWYNNGASGN